MLNQQLSKSSSQVTVRATLEFIYCTVGPLEFKRSSKGRDLMTTQCGHHTGKALDDPPLLTNEILES